MRQVKMTLSGSRDEVLAKLRAGVEYCFQCSPDGQYTIEGVCEECQKRNERSDKEVYEDEHGAWCDCEECK